MRTRLWLTLRTAALMALCVINSVPGIACRPSTTPEVRLVEEAAAALGGVDKVRRVRAMTLEGAGEVFALGQNRTIDGPLLKWQVTEYQRTIDFEHGRWRAEAVHTPTFVTGWPDPFRVTLGVDGDVAFDVEEGQATRLDAVTARDRRAELYHHPIGFLQAASAADARLEQARTEDGKDALDLIAPNGERFTLFIDRTSKLPQRIVSKSHVAALGDVTVTTDLGEFAEANSTTVAASDGAGVKVPGRLTTRIDNTVITDMRIARTVVNPPVVGDLEASADVRSASTEQPANVTVEVAAPGIWYLAGEGHHSVLVELADHLVLIEAPMDDTRTLAVIAKARELRPRKSLTQVINTHHHFDHSGGIRAAIAEGLTVITHEANRGFYEQVASRPATVAPDALATRPKPLAIETVSDKKVLTDGRRRVEIYPITDSPHCAALLMVYLPDAKLLVEADAYQPPPLNGPGPRIHPFAANLLDNIRARGLRVNRVLPIHGRIVLFEDLVAAARLVPASSTSAPTD